MSIEKLSRDVWAHHLETKSFVCHVCGLDKSRNLEESCVCACVPAVDNNLVLKRPANSSLLAGHPSKRHCCLENGIKKSETKFESQLSSSDKVQAVAQLPDLDPREGNTGKLCEGAVHMRRFNDTPAVVPIKKRRIQIMKSPSPPPRSPSPQTPLSRSSSPKAVSPARSPVSGCTPSVVLTSTLVRPAVPRPMSSFKSQPAALAGGELGATNSSSFDNAEASKTKVLYTSSTASDVDMSLAGENEHQPITIVKESGNTEDNITAQNVSGGGREAVYEQTLHNSVTDPNPSTDKQEGELPRSESSSFSRDDRLHWDLNRDMTAWDALTEQVADKANADEQVADTPFRSPSANSAETSQDHGNMSYDDAAGKEAEEEPESGEEEPEKEDLEIQRDEEAQRGFIEEVLEEEPGICEKTEENTGTGEHFLEEEPEIMEQNTHEFFEDRKVDRLRKEELIPLSIQAETAQNAKDEADLPESGKFYPLDAPFSSDGANAAALDAHCKEDEIPVKHLPKSGKQAKSLSNDAEGWNNYASEEPELEEHVDYGDSDFRDADDVGLDVDDRMSLMQEESHWKGEEGACHSVSFKRTSQEAGTSHGDGAVVRGASPSDGQQSEPGPERRTPAGRSRTTGWDQLPEGFDNAEEALKAAKEVSVRRGGRGGPWSSPVGRSSSLSSHAATRFGPGPGPARSAVRDGFSSARGDSYYGDRHADEMMYDRDGYRHGRRRDDSYGVPNSVRGRDPGRRPGVFGRGRAGGWIDSQPGHINQWGPGRRRPSSGIGGPSNAAAVGAARVENSGFIVAPDGTLTKSGAGMGPGRAGIRSTVSGGRGGRVHVQSGRGPPGDMDGGVHYPLRASGADRITGMNAGGRGLGVNSGPGYGGSMNDRGGRGLIDRYRSGGMESRRSQSPRRPYPLDHSNMMNRMPGMRSDSRVMRSRTPPASHRSVGQTDFSAARSQRSPPPPSRWSSDKRDADYQDRDFKRTLSRPHIPSQRTSPHVVHGSSLTDDRDRQVLAGSRQSPPVKGPMSSSLRKCRDDILDCRPPKRIEDEDIRHTGTFSKDGDYRRSSQMRERERDRDRGSSYRRDVDRDREDDRRGDFRRSSSRDGRFSSGPKYPNTREVDDDVAPRRRRPS